MFFHVLGFKNNAKNELETPTPTLRRNRPSRQIYTDFSPDNNWDAGHRKGPDTSGSETNTKPDPTAVLDFSEDDLADVQTSPGLEQSGLKTTIF